MRQIETTLTSLEVAEMVDRQHSEVLKDIRRIERQLPEVETHLGDFFTESVYRDANNQQRPQFLLTKKGCELYATRMTGEKGTQFAVAYIEKFNEMENQINAPMSQTELALLQAQNLHNIEKTVKTHDKKLTRIERKVDEQMTLDYGMQRRLQKAVAARVYKIDDDQQARRKLFSELYREIKDRFGVASYKDVRRQDLQTAINYVENWIPRKVAI